MPRQPEEKILSWTDLERKAAAWRESGKRIVTTNGCFDLLHWGHVKYLSRARELGHVLVVGVNSDASVARLKGPTRPLQHERERCLQLAGLEAVDHVAVFTDDTPENFLRAVRPHVHVKGADYAGREIPETALMRELGGELAFVPLEPGFSTTALVDKILKTS